MDFAIRAYHPSDLPGLYRICLLTADNGGDGSHLFDDPDLPGHVFTGPYVAYEPDLCFVLTGDGAPCGYVLGARDTDAFARRCEEEWFPILRARYPRPAPGENSRQAWLLGEVHGGFQSEPGLGAFPAHLHIDLLPVAQGQGRGAQLMTAFLNRLRELNVRGVHLGVGKSNQRAIRFYHRMGFQIVDEDEYGALFCMDLAG